MHLVPKVNKTQVSLVDNLRKLRRWHTRKNRHHGNWEYGKLERGMSNDQHVSRRLEAVWPREFAWMFIILYCQGDFDPKSWTKRKAVHRRSLQSAAVCAAQLYRLLSYFNHPYILGNKSERKVTYILMHQCFCHSLLYNIKINKGSPSDPLLRYS